MGRNSNYDANILDNELINYEICGYACNTAASIIYALHRDKRNMGFGVHYQYIKSST
jgi:hypothetical protein